MSLVNGPLPDAAELEQRTRARKNVTRLFLFAIVMFFVALSSAYIVSQGSADYWVDFRIPTAFYISTAIIVVSSLCIHLALTAIRKGAQRTTTLYLVATFVFGLAFTALQFKGWGELFAHNLGLSGKMVWAEGEYGTDFTFLRKGVPLVKEGDQYFLPDDVARAKPLNAEMEDQRNTASSYFYVLTVGHWLHLLGGMVLLAALIIKQGMGRYGPTNHTGVWQVTMYWHFLGALWIYLLLFIVAVH